MFHKEDSALVDNSSLELKKLSLVNNVSFVGASQGRQDCH